MTKQATHSVGTGPGKKRPPAKITGRGRCIYAMIASRSGQPPACSKPVAMTNSNFIVVILHRQVKWQIEIFLQHPRMPVDQLF